MLQDIILDSCIMIDGQRYQINPKINIVNFVAQIALISESNKLIWEQLQQFKYDLILDGTKNDLANVQKEVIAQTKQQTTYEIIKDTTLKDKIESIITNHPQHPTQTVEQFCDQNDHIWEQYITNACKEHLNSKVIRNMATGMSFFMIKRINTL